ncbi:MAG: hypothetical protein JXB49_35010 [Bacteroidales bacterium]|nr:hypothetical protein [Bacteroidales bacterium]
MIEDNPDIGQKTGTTLRLGANIQKSLGQHMVLHLSPFIDYQFMQDHDDYDRPDIDAYKYPGFEMMTLGFKIVIEYLFIK